jgi:hypothetical protein
VITFQHNVLYIFHKKIVEQRKSTIPTANISHSETLKPLQNFHLYRKEPVMTVKLLNACNNIGISKDFVL